MLVFSQNLFIFAQYMHHNKLKTDIHMLKQLLFATTLLAATNLNAADVKKPVWQDPQVNQVNREARRAVFFAFEDLDKALMEAKKRDELSFIEIKCSIGARDDLGRPTTTALENKQNFMDYLKEI